jgi:predicted AlkP superfamily pyrophosphatase or phosphodiesterase
MVLTPFVQSSSFSRRSKIAAVLVVLVAFLAFVFGAYRASGSSSSSSYIAKALSNGTHEFAPTTVIISLDGFRADFLHRRITPTLSSFVQQGVSPRYMTPSFPSLTFPNHFTLVTGMYPESHGIVGNNFYDPDLREQFTYTNPALSLKPEYWNAEPVWETAERQNVRTAIHMWPGSEAHIGSMEPTHVDKFNMHEPLDNKVARILGWLDLPGPNDPGYSDENPRPQLIAAYVPNVDSDGHKYGPNSTAIRTSITEVDDMLGKLFTGMEERNLTSVVNIIIVSDHGMATTSTTRLIQLEDLVDTSLIEHIDGWPLQGLRPYNTSAAQLDEIYHGILANAERLGHDGKFDVYLRDQNMPARFHFRHNARIAPLWIVPQTGWAIVPRPEFDVAAALARGDVYAPRGLHGYDHEHPLMRAIFVARGPAFPHAPHSAVAPFQNVELYNIVCDSLGVAPRPNNGSVRLPFATLGVHGDVLPEDLPEDLVPVEHGVGAGLGVVMSSALLEVSIVGTTVAAAASAVSASASAVSASASAVSTPAASASASASSTSASPSSDRPGQPAPSSASAVPSDADKTDDAGKEDGAAQEHGSEKEDGANDRPGDESTSWRQWITGKIDEAKHWVTGLFGEHKQASQEAPQV